MLQLEAAAPLSTLQPADALINCIPPRALCQPTAGTADTSGSTGWSNLPNNMFNQTCRQDLAGLFGKSQWDGYLADRIRRLPESCGTHDEGFAEIQVRVICCWTGGLLV
jgi:hypothetical protein